MKPTQLGYTAVALGEISQALTRLFASDSAPTGVRTLGANALLPVCSSAALNEVEEHVHALSILHPSRFFLIVLDPEAQTLRAEVAARCHAVPFAEPICCEIIRLFSPPKLFPPLLEVLRAQLVSGVRTELFLYDASCPPELLRELASLSDQLFFDSARFEADLEAVPQIAGMLPNVVDLRWIGLRIWRDSITDVFSNPTALTLLNALESISISSCTGPASPPILASELLLVGWLLNCLQMEVGSPSMESSGRTCLRCRSKLLPSFTLRLEPPLAGPSPRVLSASFRCRDGGTGEIVEISVSRDEAIHCRIGAKTPIVFERRLDDESHWGLIRRYFQFDEPLSDYFQALRAGISVLGLASGSPAQL